MVGRYTGSGPSVVAALRRRGYSVERAASGSYEITAGPVAIATSAPASNSEGLVERALAHIASIHPSVDQVVYDDDLRWYYSGGVSPIVFNKTEDIGLLEDAADEAYTRGLINVAIKLGAAIKAEAHHV